MADICRDVAIATCDQKVDEEIQERSEKIQTLACKVRKELPEWMREERGVKAFEGYVKSFDFQKKTFLMLFALFPRTEFVNVLVATTATTVLCSTTTNLSVPFRKGTAVPHEIPTRLSPQCVCAQIVCVMCLSSNFIVKINPDGCFGNEID